MGVVFADRDGTELAANRSAFPARWTDVTSRGG